jgi:hypothetical protein
LEKRINFASRRSLFKRNPVLNRWHATPFHRTPL